MNESTAMDRFTCVIPAGGAGSRLWPLSRANAPKFLLDLTGSGNSLLRTTWDRLTPLVPAERIMVVTGSAHRDSVKQQLPEIAADNLVIETEPKDSSAAIGLAAALLELRDPDAILGSFAADHVIRGSVLFQRAVRTAVQAADQGYIATIGIHPAFPSTGFGYIACGQARGDLAPFDVLTGTGLRNTLSRTSSPCSTRRSTKPASARSQCAQSRWISGAGSRAPARARTARQPPLRPSGPAANAAADPARSAFLPPVRGTLRYLNIAGTPGASGNPRLPARHSRT